MVNVCIAIMVVCLAVIAGLRVVRLVLETHLELLHEELLALDEKIREGKS